MTDSPIEKKPVNENFPVASFLLPSENRHDILAFYHFVRMADDIADHPTLSADRRERQLLRLDAALKDGTDLSDVPTLTTLYTAAQSTPSLIHHARGLLSAFVQDCRKSRYATWAELLGYCEFSANPVGRAVLDICGEDKADLAAADALCTALQILNHIQDVQSDYMERDRIYLPAEWMEAEGCMKTMLIDDQMSPQLRAVIDRMLDATALLIKRSYALPITIQQWRLRCEVATIIAVAERLHRKLQHADICAQHVHLSRLAYASCFVDALTGGWQKAAS